MPRQKPDPILDVLRYFEETDLSLAQQALILAQATIRRRVARPGLTKLAKATTGGAPKPAAAPPPATAIPNAAPIAPRRRRASGAATEPIDPLNDKPLPRLGPATVGD